MPARVRVLEMTQPTHDSNTLIHMAITGTDLAISKNYAML